jgi:SAM-dependent methyltransferase/uncharacterized protein YbaR (Trm112 family)
MSGTANLIAVEQLRRRLRCPACHKAMPWSAGGRELSCNTCGAKYPILPSGIPLLLTRDQQGHFSSVLTQNPDGARMAEEYRRFGTWRAQMHNFFKPPSIAYDEDVARKYSWIYDTRGEQTVVLSIGGGPGRENPRAVNLNIDAFDSVDFVGDGINLPFMDQSVDSVTCNAVIEHVSNPQSLVSEMYRVLKPGGYAQMMIPFIFPFHAYPADYQRYSAAGILELTKSLEKVELCVLTGPTSAMLVMFREYLRILMPGGNGRAARMALNGISGWITFPLKYLDHWLNRKPDAANLAAAFFFLGRRPFKTV